VHAPDRLDLSYLACRLCCLQAFSHKGANRGALNKNNISVETHMVVTSPEVYYKFWSHKATDLGLESRKAMLSDKAISRYKCPGMCDRKTALANFHLALEERTITAAMIGTCGRHGPLYPPLSEYADNHIDILKDPDFQEEIQLHHPDYQSAYQSVDLFTPTLNQPPPLNFF
jgi:predicted small lipoprotein YifL